MNMSRLFCAKLIALFCFVVNRSNAQEERSVNFRGCQCDGLQCNCYAGTKIPNAPEHEVCLNIMLIPNEVALRGTVTIDGKNVYTGQLDPSVAPICSPTIPGICLAINHIDVEKRQICTKLSLSFLILVKFPCIRTEQGILLVEPNMYV